MTDKQIIIDAFNSAWNRKVATESSYGKLASKEVFENNNEDKQIIIDGVDVKDCIAYAKSQTVYLGNTLYNQAENICMVKNQPCKFFDCQFKQMARELKRKEQECEELMDKAYKDADMIYVLNQQLDQLKAERKILDDEAVVVEITMQQFEEYNQLKAENENLKQYKASKQASYESMQREWNRAVNANRELKADNKHLNDLLNQALKELEQSREAVEKVKELIQKEIADCEHCGDCTSCEYNCCLKQAKQICDEVTE